MSEFERLLPAWSEPFVGEARRGLGRALPLGPMSREWALGSGPGAAGPLDGPGADPTAGCGVTVAIVDSGVEGDHPAIGGKLVGGVKVVPSPDPDVDPEVVDDPDGPDLVGHGTACAGIVHSIAPGADLVSVRVLGPNNRARGIALAAGLDWAIRHGASVVNLSLSSRSDALFGLLHELADQAYFSNVVLVCAANNAPGNSYPSLFSSVVSVAAHDVPDAGTWFYNPRPPVEFGARGVDMPVAWRGGGHMVATGNSFAAPHISGVVARIRWAHPEATPFEIKTILAATATPIG
jgi:subtilisin